MKKIIFILILFISGCSIPICNLKPSAIYKLDDGKVIKVYRTNQENIYIKGNDFSVVNN